MNDAWPKTTGEVAELLSVQASRVARLFEMGIIDEPHRSAGRRMISASMVPLIAAEMRRRGWIKNQEDKNARRD